MNNWPSTLYRNNILGVGVTALDIPMAVSVIATWISDKKQHYICCTNTHLLVEANSNPILKKALNHAGMVTPDGMPLVWISRLLGSGNVKRVYGPDLMLAVCERSIQMGWSHYFYGAGPGVADQLAQRLSAHFPGLNVVGTYTPPFHLLDSVEDEAEIKIINDTKPDIVWVGIGAPKQEIWMADHEKRITAPVMIGVGAAFDFHAGLKPQAPRWMQRSGLEWLFRLISEPGRLGKRYLTNNPKFVALFLLQLSGLKRFEIEKQFETES